LQETKKKITNRKLIKIKLKKGFNRNITKGTESIPVPAIEKEEHVRQI